MKASASTAFVLAAIVAISAPIALTACTGTEAVGSSMPTSISEPLVLEDGDGDPNWLHERHFVQNINPRGFSGEIGDWYGTALLFRVLGPNHEGEFIALTPRTPGTIEEQLLTSGVASVIVHRFSCDEIALQTGMPCESTAIGMSVLRSPNDTRWR